jgi:hypothetical protein
MNGSDETFEEWSARWKRERDAAVQAERLFNNSAIDRVITAVGKPPSDRDALADELERLARSHSLWRDANDQPAVGAIGKWLAGFVGAVRTARDFLAHPPVDDHEFLAKLMFVAGQDRHDISQVRHAIEGVQVLKDTFGRLLRDKSYGLDWIGSRNAAAHWLIGKTLPGVYTQYFGKTFGYSRDKVTGEPSGPGIRFILEVLAIMKVNTPRDGKLFGSDAVEYYLRLAGY